MNQAELEITIHRPQAGIHQVEQRFTTPRSEAEISPVWAACPLNPQELLPLQLNPTAYGRTLADQLFQQPEALAFYREIKAATEATDLVLRVRLRLDANAPELHALRWELLIDPVINRPLTTSERILFSRFMTSNDKRPVQLRPKATLRALVAVANPVNIDGYSLAPVDLDGEIERARQGLTGIEVEVAG
ncbi:MAG: hypothetical protein D3925_13095, partial [Candidatus Electrothrix sp. AR5]|nr:hypothetical protein [Candidatus Electrothrix sp. AR5]